MSNTATTPGQDPLSAYRVTEPRRFRDPFADPALRGEIARIAEARARRVASGWRFVLFGWVSAAPRAALAGAALSAALLLGGVAGQFHSAGESVAQMDAGAVPLASSDVIASKADSGRLASGEFDAWALASSAALLLLTGSLATVFVTVRRRRA